MNQRDYYHMSGRTKMEFISMHYVQDLLNKNVEIMSH